LFRLFGVHEWVARLHAALATLGSLLLVGWIARRRFGPEGSAWAAAVFITMPLVLVPGRVGTLDALLAVHVLAIVALDVAHDDRPRRYRAVATGALLGLAFLVKGPVGVILPLLIMLAGRTATRRVILPAPRAVLNALAAWCVVVLPWGLAFAGRVGWNAALLTVRREVLERYFAGSVHSEPAWFFLPVAAAGFSPWLAPLLVGLVDAWRLRRDPVAGTAVYAAAGLVVGAVFFSLGRSKVAGYILPLAPLAALLVTWELGREIAAPRRHALGSTLLAATLASSSLLLGLAGLPRLEGPARAFAVAGTIALGAGALAAVVGTILRRPRTVYGAAASASAVVLLAAALLLHPAIGRTHSAAGLIAAVPELAAPRPLVTVEVRVPSLMFYLDRIPEVCDMHGFAERIARDDRALFVLVDVDLPAVPPDVAARLREVGRHGKYRVFEKRPSVAPALDDPPAAG